jgi:YidC/Oxa1 family membrane protein insertase
MEQQRLLLFVALLFIGFLIWEAWQKDYGPQPQPSPTTQTEQPTSDQTTGAPAPEQSGSATDQIPVPGGGEAPSGGTPSTKAPGIALDSAQRIVVDTDVIHAEIDTLGGDLRKVQLPKYPVDVDDPDKPFTLLDDSSKLIYVAQSGLFTREKDNAKFATGAPDHHTRYQADQNHYQLGNQDKLDVSLHWVSPQGVKFTKTYHFERGKYLVDLTHHIENQSGKPWRGNIYYRIQHSAPQAKGGIAHLPVYTGPVVYSPEDKYRKISFDDIDDVEGTPKDAIDKEFAGGWGGMIQHYFVSAWIPPKDQTFRYFTSKVQGSRYLIGLSSPQINVPPNSDKTLTARLFTGPKLPDRLEAIAPGLDLAVDYGWLTILSKPLYWILKQIHGFVGNWGWAIILLTIMIKAVFYKLSETSYKSMAKLRKVTPKMQQIKERYADDKEKQRQALFELQRKEKINPLGGCLPIAVQIPVFIALYYMILESVELRQAPWIFWIQDLSTKDPYFILPIIMGLSMLAQQKLNPTPVDPVQAKVMMVLPVVFTGLFMFFPSGLVLYWVVNNILSISQQYYITRYVVGTDKHPVKKKA